MSSEEAEVIAAVEKVTPAVVSISTLQEYRDFFYTRPVQGMGSGVIVHPDGYIATNYHVVQMSEEIVITKSDGERLEGHVVGTDKYSDLAVIKVEKNSLPSAELADSDKLKVGQTVIAMGSPFGFFLGGLTVTKGVISAVHRDISAEEGIFEDLIQTDAAINPGNSGGPLVDLRGNVVGLNSAMIPFAQGIGFAIPSNTVRKIVEDLILYGRVSRSWLGIMGMDIDRSVARRYGLSVESGVGIADVARDGPARRAGLRAGDVITMLDEKKVDSVKDLRRLIRAKKPGEKMTIEIVRDGRTYRTEVVLSEER
ncbi:MAG: trypsin-like peptidase domain-containing protein [Conexivisphaerales archaeon]